MGHTHTQSENENDDTTRESSETVHTEGIASSESEAVEAEVKTEEDAGGREKERASEPLTQTHR